MFKHLEDVEAEDIIAGLVAIILLLMSVDAYQSQTREAQVKLIPGKIKKLKAEEQTLIGFEKNLTSEAQMLAAMEKRLRKTFAKEEARAKLLNKDLQKSRANTKAYHARINQRELKIAQCSRVKRSGLALRKRRWSDGSVETLLIPKKNGVLASRWSYACFPYKGPQPKLPPKNR